MVAPLYAILSLIALSSRYVPFLSTLASHGKTMKRQSNWLSIAVPKSYFAHFYIIGLASLATFWYSAGEFMPFITSVLLLFHLSRRLYECFYVHQFRQGSKMHILGYFLGVGHYFVLPLSFLGKYETTERISPIHCACYIFNIWMQREQYLHHKILAEIRNGTAGTPVYRSPPNKRWFRRSYCPHYFAEIMIYFSWAILLAHHTALDFSSKDLLSENLPPVLVSWLLILAQHRHCLLFVWVSTNLGVSALNSRDWYLREYPKLKRNALIPI